MIGAVIGGVTLSWLEPLLGNIDLWRGIARFVLDLALLYALFIVVLAASGHTVTAWPLKTRTPHQPQPDHKRENGTHLPESVIPSDPTPEALHALEMAGLALPLKAGAPAPTTSSMRQPSTEKHRELEDQLRTVFKYQSSTVVLIVFAVLLLGIQHILTAMVIAPILSGIAGFVLGQSKSGSGDASDASPNSGAHHG